MPSILSVAVLALAIGLGGKNSSGASASIQSRAMTAEQCLDERMRESGMTEEEIKERFYSFSGGGGSEDDGSERRELRGTNKRGGSKKAIEGPRKSRKEMIRLERMKLDQKLRSTTVARGRKLDLCDDILANHFGKSTSTKSSKTTSTKRSKSTLTKSSKSTSTKSSKSTSTKSSKCVKSSKSSRTTPSSSSKSSSCDDSPTFTPTPANPTVTLSPTAKPTPTSEPTTAEPTPEPTPNPTASGSTYSPTTLTPPPPIPEPPCNLTPSERDFKIWELLSRVSGGVLFTDPLSPQARAFRWIVEEDKAQIQPVVCPNQTYAGCNRNGDLNQLVQRYVLAAFYFATDGKNWSNCSEEGDCDKVVTPFDVANERVGDTGTANWLGPENECEWGGVACWGSDTPDLNLCLDQLEFQNNNVSGVLIPELSALTSMRFLSLEEGTISGPIPTEYGELNRLLFLDMDSNEISGEIPEEIYGLGSLQQLDLYNNKITGSISSSIGNLQSLTSIDVSSNQLNNTIPSEMGLLQNLTSALLNANDLTGQMPSEVCALRNDANPPGLLEVLGISPEVFCSCCTFCF